MEFKIGKIWVGENHPTLIIAEMSGNHAGKIQNAIKIIRMAKEIGADAVKLQTYTADTITLDSNKEDFCIPKDSPWAHKKTLHKLYQEAYTPWEWHAELFEEAQKVGIEIFSSPFDLTAVDFLEELGAPAYKIASPEITDIPLIKKVARTGKPVILSTGLAKLEDIELAVKTLHENQCKDYAFLKCTSAYPTPIEDANLAMIPELSKRFNCLSGLSDHTIGTVVPVASVAFGGKIIEKHFTLTEIGESVDSFFSLNEEQFSQMISDVRIAEKSFGKVSFEISPSAVGSLNGRRSLYVAKDIKVGETLNVENFRSVRPSYGLHPKYYESLIGKKAKRDLSIGDRIQLKDFE